VPDLLPNSLGKVPREDRRLGLPGTWFILYCASCHVEGGRVMDTYLPAQYAFYLCDTCANKFGEIAGCTKTPDDVFFSKVAEAIREEYGHDLTEPELLAALGDPHSIVTMLETEGRRR
jgi:hypothetical protein